VPALKCLAEEVALECIALKRGGGKLQQFVVAGDVAPRLVARHVMDAARDGLPIAR
jgi:hypothetical protein